MTLVSLKIGPKSTISVHHLPYQDCDLASPPFSDTAIGRIVGYVIKLYIYITSIYYLVLYIYIHRITILVLFPLHPHHLAMIPKNVLVVSS